MAAVGEQKGDGFRGWAGASRAAGRAPGAERGFEPMARRSKNENYLQFLHTGERVFGEVALFVLVFIIT